MAILLSSVFVFAVNPRWTFDHRAVRLPHHSAARFAAVPIGSHVLVSVRVTMLTANVLVWNIVTFLLTITIGFGRFSLYWEWVYTDHGQRPVD